VLGFDCRLPARGTGWRRPNHAALDLAVAVGAHEYALRRLSPELGQPFAGRHAQGEGLRQGINVVEVQVDDAAVVATDRTAPAGLLNEDALHLLEPPCYGLASAALAPPAMSPLSLPAPMKRYEAVVSADPELAGAVDRGRAAALVEEWDRRL